MNIIIILLGLLGVGLAGLLMAGSRAKMQIKAKYPPPGELIEIGGYRLHISRQGQGGPAVIMDAGVGGTGLHWALVQPEIAKLTQTVAYDRAGLGWSDKAPQPRSFERMVEELHTLLKEANIPAPYVLVGHSFGGIIVRQFARRYPELVIGLVLIDSAHEEQYQRFPEPLREMAPRMLKAMQIMKLLPALGITALKPAMMPLDKRVPLAIAEADRATRIWGASHIETTLKETEAVIFDPPDKLETLGGLPLIVLSHGVAQPMPNVSAEVNTAYEQIWQQMQRELAALSSNSQHIIVEGAGHDIQLERPQVVVQAIQQILERVRIMA
jgi:pimeloyl-ACP methyl ester carboxylesterase